MSETTGRTLIKAGVDKHVYYGVCNSEEDDPIKEVLIENPTIYIDESSNIVVDEINTSIVEDDSETEETTGPIEYLDLSVGDQLVVTFVNGNTCISPTLSLHIRDLDYDINFTANSGRIVLGSSISIDCSLKWGPGDVINFFYAKDANETEYWKANILGPAAEDRYGSVKIADDLSDIENADDQTAITLGLFNQLSDQLETLGLEWSDPESTEEEEVIIGSISLVTSSDPERTISIPRTIFRTGQLANDGDGSEGSYYFNPNDNIWFNNDQAGIGYYVEVADGSQVNDNLIKNFIPVDIETTNDGNQNNVHVGYGSLEAYQAEFLDSNSQLIETDPKTWIYGKEILNAIDEDGSFDIGTIDLYPDQGEDGSFESLYQFSKNGAFINKPVGLYSSPIHNANTLNYYFGNSNAVFKPPVALTEASASVKITTKALDVYDDNTNDGEDNGEYVSLNEYILRRLPPSPTRQYIGVNDNTTVPTGLVLIKRVTTPVLRADKKGHFKAPGQETTHILVTVPTYENYTPIGLGGYNVSQAPDTTYWASNTNLWEYFLGYDEQTGTGVIQMALVNLRDAIQEMIIEVDVIYLRNSWRA